ncbi:hypothetical protein DM02DRAFT_125003 [Periconia macrospinosa]|uniref:Zn(2)-C6 fungal-type domain-containing protein n=1 Tax=Periconia macrospinosa TaxID=97972 RepID=A0A2V1E3C8_9PLEO|nr:hypothetical protein DM02DRAFT_125003 [Periconia macrospinosa]
MASTASYGDPDVALGGASGIYVNQNGSTSQAQQQQQHMHTDPDIQMRENIQQLQATTAEMMQHQSAPQAHQMNALSAAHHHYQTPPRPTHSPQHMAQSAQSVMGMEDHNVYGDDSASRKRSKVSRACDECRRKKIRCDATSENGPEACSSCKRTGARCQFSRQPMKRGPSKGYIKELAERVFTLENQMGSGPPTAYDLGSVGEQMVGDAQPPPQLQRKRTHSMSETFTDNYNRPWSGHDRGIFSTHDDDVYTLTGQESAPNGMDVNSNRRVSFGEMSLAGSLITGSNEATIKAYYDLIHPALPLLPQNSTPLNHLTHSPPKLREAFFVSLECAVRSFSSRALPSIETSPVQLIHQCYETVDSARHLLNDGDSSRQLFNNLVYCQSLIFLIIASDRPGPSTVGSTAELLGRLAGCISDSGLNDAKVLSLIRSQDIDIYEAARRTFWVTFILDRFHAASREKNALLPPHSGSVSLDDYKALGDVGYHLARAADIIGQVAFITQATKVPNMDSSSPNIFAVLSATLPATVYVNGQLNRFRESLEISPLTVDAPPYLAFQYLRIYVARHSEQGSPSDTLVMAKELLGNLLHGSITPLHHILASLVAATLTDLSDCVETQVEAHASIKEMSDALANGQIVHRSIDNLGWDVALRDLLHQRKASTPPNAVSEQTNSVNQPNMAGLQHLAEAAVGEREGTDTRPASSAGNGAPSNNSTVDHDLKAAMAAASEAAAAQATAALAEQQLQNVPTEGNGNSNSNNYDSGLNKDGFIAALT